MKTTQCCLFLHALFLLFCAQPTRAEIIDYALLKLPGHHNILLLGECHTGTKNDPAQQNTIQYCLSRKTTMPSILLEKPLPTFYINNRIYVADQNTGALFSPYTQNIQSRSPDSFICSKTAKETNGFFYDERHNAPFSIKKLILCSIATWKFTYTEQNFKQDIDPILSKKTFAGDMQTFKTECISLLKEDASNRMMKEFKIVLKNHKPHSYIFRHFSQLTSYITHIADAAFLAKILTLGKEKPTIFFAGAAHTRFLAYVLQKSGAYTRRKADPKYGAVAPRKLQGLLYLLDMPQKAYIPRPIVITRANYPTLAKIFPSTSGTPLIPVAKWNKKSNPPAWKLYRP